MGSPKQLQLFGQGKMRHAPMRGPRLLCVGCLKEPVARPGSNHACYDADVAWQAVYESGDVRHPSYDGFRRCQKLRLVSPVL